MGQGIVTPNALETELLGWLHRLGWARMHHLVGLTGASGPYVTRSMTAMRRAGWVDTVDVTAHLGVTPKGGVGHPGGGVGTAPRGGGVRGGVTPATPVPNTRVVNVPAWYLTPAGVKHVPEVLVPGVERVAKLGAVRKIAQVDHRIACVDVAVRCARGGYQVVTERMIRSVEQSTESQRAQAAKTQKAVAQKPRHFSGQVGWAPAHYPDLALITPTGVEILVEVELATKLTAQYRDAMAANAVRGLTQVWLVESPIARARLIEAAEALGHAAEQTRADGVWISRGNSVIIGPYYRERAVVGDVARKSTRAIDELFAGPLPGALRRYDTTIDAAWRQLDASEMARRGRMAQGTAGWWPDAP